MLLAQPVSTITLENKQQEIPNHPASSTRSMRRKKDASARTASAKSIVLVNPEDQSVVVIENSFSKTERFKPPIRQTRYTKKSQSNNTNVCISEIKIKTKLDMKIFIKIARITIN